MSNYIIKKDVRLNHLTDEQIEELIKKYYNGVKTNKLIEEYEIDIASNSLYTIFPPEVCNDKICPNCNVALVRKRVGKTSFRYGSTASCPICGHEDTFYCKCKKCVEKRELETIERKRQQELENIKKSNLIKQNYAFDRFEYVAIEELNFIDRVYLGALLRLYMSEQLTVINPIDSTDIKLAPTVELKQDIVRTLSSQHIICVHPESPMDAFTGDEENPFPSIYYTYKVFYYLNIGADDINKVVSELMNPSEFAIDGEEALYLWKKIAVSECLEYLNYQMNKVGFEFKPGEKTIATFTNLLENFSVSQIYGIIYKGVTQATRYYQEKNVNKRQASNSVIGNCQRYAENALINGWELKKFGRNYDIPQSKISEFFFNRVLKIGDIGFDMPPSF